MPGRLPGRVKRRQHFRQTKPAFFRSRSIHPRDLAAFDSQIERIQIGVTNNLDSAHQLQLGEIIAQDTRKEPEFVQLANDE